MRGGGGDGVKRGGGVDRGRVGREQGILGCKRPFLVSYHFSVFYCEKRDILAPSA